VQNRRSFRPQDAGIFGAESSIPKSQNVMRTATVTTEGQAPPVAQPARR
jgi:hypothetical protein